MTTLSIDNTYNMCTFPKSFWHTNNTIFDVNIHCNNEFIAMVSFSKNKVNWWPQKCLFWKDWNPSILDINTDLLLKKQIQKNKLITRLIKKAESIYHTES